MNETMNTTPVGGLVILKNITYIGAFIASTAYLGINPESVAILSGLVITDVITGVMKSAVVYGARSIRSSRLASGVLAKLLLIFIPITLALSGKGIGMDISPIVQASITVLILSEAYSIIGNIHSVQTRKEKVEFDAVAFILRMLRNTLEKFTVDDPKKSSPPPNE